MHINDQFFDEIRNNLARIKRGEYPFDLLPGASSSIYEKILCNIYEEVLNDEEKFKQAMLRFSDPKAIAIKIKRKNKVTGMRTYRILPGLDGKPILVVSYKGKRLDGTYRDWIPIKGFSKHRKIAMVVSGDTPQIFAELMVPLRNQAEYVAVCKEISMQQKFHGIPGFADIINAGLELKTKIVNGFNTPCYKQVVILAPFKYTLYDLIAGVWRPQEIDISNPIIARKTIASILLQLSEIIEKMQAMGVEHKDLKSENLLLSLNKDLRSFYLENTDFGAAVDFGDKDRLDGTPAFVPPWQLCQAYNGLTVDQFEQDANTKHFVASLAWIFLREEANKNGGVISGVDDLPVAGKHDIWSFGCIMYEMLFGTIKRHTSYTDVAANIAKIPMLQDIFKMQADQMMDAVTLKQKLITSNFYTDADALQWPAVSATQNSMQSSTIAVDSWLSDPCAEIRSYAAMKTIKERESAIENLCHLMPNQDLIKKFNLPFDEEDDRMTYNDLLIMAKKNLTPEDLHGAYVYYIDLLESIDEALGLGAIKPTKKIKVNDTDWSELIKFKIFLNSAALLTMLELQTTYAVKTKQTSRGKIKPEALLYQQPLGSQKAEDKQEINRLHLELSSLSKALCQELGPKSFNRLYQ